MRLVVTGRNVEIDPALRQLIERKVGKLERMLNDSLVSAQVVLTLQRHRHVTEITAHARGDHMLRGLADAENWRLSLGGAIEKITQQAHKLKDKWARRKRRATGRRTLPALAPAEPEPAQAPRIVRARRAAIKPMSLEDAALRVDAGHETFLVFRNASTDAINILYRRKDGHLGLIEPEI
jgi:putative sigma-54 modulation protein